MTIQFFLPTYQQITVLVFACMLPFAAMGNTDDTIAEKRIGVAMRMIGHEVLTSLGDRDSRVMPIEKNGRQYKIPFEKEFGFDPEAIISIIDSVMTEVGISDGYLVEVERCKTKEVVHSFQVGKAGRPDLIPCKGRVLPEDCYSLLITLLDGTTSVENLQAITPERPATALGLLAEALPVEGAASHSSILQKENTYPSAYWILPLLLLLGLTGYFIWRKKSDDIDPDLIRIGASVFDKRNMLLTFENNSVELSHKETELLTLLHTAANETLEREVLLQKVWGDEGDYVGRTLDVFISKLRKKLEADTSVKIVNIRGVGYKLVTDVVVQY